MKKPEFTKEQENWLCDVIGDWYLSWKDRISSCDTHRLGFAKEELKALICDEDFNIFVMSSIVNGFINTEEFVKYYADKVQFRDL